jgi:hypothetical protein
MTTSTAASPTEPFVYRLKELVKVIDVDTVDLDLDLGFSLTLRQRVRLYGVDAPANELVADRPTSLSADTKLRPRFQWGSMRRRSPPRLMA